MIPSKKHGYAGHMIIFHIWKRNIILLSLNHITKFSDSCKRKNDSKFFSFRIGGTWMYAAEKQYGVSVGFSVCLILANPTHLLDVLGHRVRGWDKLIRTRAIHWET